MHPQTIFWPLICENSKLCNDNDAMLFKIPNSEAQMTARE